MGHNRGGDDRKARLKRRHREEARLARKAAAGAQQPGILEKVKNAAVAGAEKVGEAIKGAAQAVKNAVT